MKKSLILVLSAALTASAAGCASKMVVLANVKSRDRKLDLVINLEKKKAEDFVWATIAHLSPDKTRLSVYYNPVIMKYRVNPFDVQGMQNAILKARKIVFDVSSGKILEVTDVPQGEMMKFMDIGMNQQYSRSPYHASMSNKSADGKYTVIKTFTPFNRLISVTDNATNKTWDVNLGWMTPMGVKITKANLLVVSCIDNRMSGKELIFIKLSDGSTVASYVLPNELQSRFNIFGSSFGKMIQNSMQSMGMSTDAQESVIVNQASLLIQAYDLKNASLKGSFIVFDEKNWLAVAPSGAYDGTDEAMKLLSWKVSKKEFIPLNDFDRSFYRRGVMAEIFGLRAAPRDDVGGLNIAAQLIGKVRKIEGGEIIVTSPRAAETMRMGEKVFVIINGKKVMLDVKFPMMSLAKCQLRGEFSSYRDRLAPGMPVFK